jgi:hypothetical protein
MKTLQGVLKIDNREFEVDAAIATSFSYVITTRVDGRIFPPFNVSSVEFIPPPLGEFTTLPNELGEVAVVTGRWEFDTLRSPGKFLICYPDKWQILSSQNEETIKLVHHNISI